MIPERDIKFIKKKAFNLYVEGKGQNEIKELILSEGGSEEQIQLLSEKFLEDYNFIKKENSKIIEKKSSNYINIGISFLVIGVLISLLTYIFSDRVYVIFYGIIVLGLIFVLIGVLEKPKSKK